MLKSVLSGFMGVVAGTILMTGVACAQVIGSTTYVIKDLNVQVPPSTRLFNMTKVCKDGKAHVIAWFQHLKNKTVTTETYRMRQYDPTGEKPDIDVKCKPKPVKKRKSAGRLT